MTAVISRQAAEVISFRRNDNNIETVWCRDPQYWYNCNPVLFPYTGPLIDGKYEYEGKEYHLGQHGFARRAVFEIDEHDQTSVTLSLRQSGETLAVYPFPFVLKVRYHLEGYRLILSYEVSNPGEKKLPFDIGFHPAFNCPVTSDKKYEDYWIEFELDEDLHHPLKNIPDGHRFQIAEHLKSGSFFYENGQIKSRYCDLTDGEHVIRVSKEGFETIGFWHKDENTPFMCIEPWSPVSSLEKENFFRPDTAVNLLNPGEKFSCEYYIELVR